VAHYLENIFSLTLNSRAEMPCFEDITTKKMLP